MAVHKPAQLTIQSTLTAFSEYLSGKAVDSPRLSAELVLRKILGISRLDILINSDRKISEDEFAQMEPLILRRGTGEPAAYIMGEREFYGRPFNVNSHTLIPRPETEHLIEAVIERYADKGSFSFADLGTGSGCIATTIAAELPKAHGVAVDLSEGALATAKENIRINGVADRVKCIRADFTTSLFKNNTFDVIATNPPYVSQSEYIMLDPEVQQFEPASALVPGDSGLEHGIRLIALAAQWLRPSGFFIMEMGFWQGAEFMSEFAKNATQWRDTAIIKDLSGHDRFVCGYKV
ncbi:peptide chain release factor N(5)-glutamine methyltransferase [Halodesulfovibrio sp.]|jgi:release factor glutamine methyltransferase|uniref:peptide chain release factor N(5)-glutamine methyltransferase n=1 Tax=Halodesulfovibrio sp. TaxID=1912772 RepID=UPI0025DC5328|nr:peptide chain release factor N(5)-glutamine methyltransferase [Halodesulfovibrio sp.]MCT4535712.1 peptide chain release factor N(5)-glutamine methyltransferase [Halodesulfovibrio sp.]